MMGMKNKVQKAATHNTLLGSLQVDKSKDSKRHQDKVLLLGAFCDAPAEFVYLHFTAVLSLSPESESHSSTSLF